MIKQVFGPGGTAGTAVRVAGIAYALVWATGCDSEAAAPEPKYAAFDVCTQFVEDRLRAPGSAEFPNEFEDDGEVTFTQDPADADVWTVVSHVDSHNGFGAMLRNDFTCKVRHVDGERWTLLDLQMTGQ